MKCWALLGDRRNDFPLLQTEGSRAKPSRQEGHGVTCSGLCAAGLWFSKHHVTFTDVTAPFLDADSSVSESSLFLLPEEVEKNSASPFLIALIPNPPLPGRW